MPDTTKIFHLPDMEYTKWINVNKDLLDEILKSGKVSTEWLKKQHNKKFLIRYYEELGYVIHID